MGAARGDTEHVNNPSMMFNFMLTLVSVQTSCHSSVLHTMFPLTLSHIFFPSFSKACLPFYWKGRNHPGTLFHVQGPTLYPLIFFLSVTSVFSFQLACFLFSWQIMFFKGWRELIWPCGDTVTYTTVFLLSFCSLWPTSQTCSSKWSVTTSSFPVQSRFLTHDFGENADEKVIDDLIK